MTLATDDLWSLVQGRPQIDPDALAQTVSAIAGQGQLDFRTRLLVRDALWSLRRRWGSDRLNRWLSLQPRPDALRQLLEADLGPAGFPTLDERLMEKTSRETVLQFLRELGSQLTRPTHITIGGSIALILADMLSRHTEDIDLVDEVPADLRSEHELLASLAHRYGLRLTHFQSHYLPAGWENRTRSLGFFGHLHASAIDPYDLFIGKLFSAREKDRDDLRALWPGMDRSRLLDLLRTSATVFLTEPQLRQNAERNWYILTGEQLPV